MIEITAREAARTVLAAHAAGTLAAQAPWPKAAYYLEQEGKVYRCAIGQLFSEEQAKEIENGPNYALVIGLIDKELIVTDDHKALKKLQVEHDNWITGSGSEGEFLQFARELAQ